jgi:hypothetical protein
MVNKPGLHYKRKGSSSQNAKGKEAATSSSGRVFKAIVRHIPSYLTEEKFFQGFSIDIPIVMKYFVPCPSLLQKQQKGMSVSAQIFGS